MKYYKLKGQRVIRAKTKQDAKGSEGQLVVLTKLPNDIDVSTVFLGGLSPMFETLVFRSNKGDDSGGRYSSWLGAQNGHIETLKDEMGRK